MNLEHPTSYLPTQAKARISGRARSANIIMNTYLFAAMNASQPEPGLDMYSCRTGEMLLQSCGRRNSCIRRVPSHNIVRAAGAVLFHEGLSNPAKEYRTCLCHPDVVLCRHTTEHDGIVRTRDGRKDLARLVATIAPGRRRVAMALMADECAPAYQAVAAKLGGHLATVPELPLVASRYA